MIGSNIGAMLAAAGDDRREAQIAVWTYVLEMMDAKMTAASIRNMAESEIKALRDEINNRSQT